MALYKCTYYYYVFWIIILFLSCVPPLQAFDLAEQDVDKALSAFNKTGKVPASVLEARYSGRPNCSFCQMFIVMMYVFVQELMLGHFPINSYLWRGFQFSAHFF